MTGTRDTSKAIPRQSAVFDERRNSSRVFPVPPDALPEALAALAAFRKGQPALYQWIADGAPRLTVDSHRERFRASYKATRSRSTSSEAS